jgi:hypothetical protein
MSRVNLYLCCNGHADSLGFTYCNSTRNLILDLSSVDTENIDTKKLIDFIKNATGLFDGPVISNNKSFNIINLLHRDFGLFSKEYVLKMQKYFIMHKDCGVYLELIVE